MSTSRTSHGQHPTSACRAALLLDRMNDGLVFRTPTDSNLASAGFGKTTLVSEWLAGCGRLGRRLSLDAGENDRAALYDLFLSLCSADD